MVYIECPIFILRQGEDETFSRYYWRFGESLAPNHSFSRKRICFMIWFGCNNLSKVALNKFSKLDRFHSLSENDQWNSIECLAEVMFEKEKINIHLHFWENGVDYRLMEWKNHPNLDLFSLRPTNSNDLPYAPYDHPVMHIFSPPPIHDGVRYIYGDDYDSYDQVEEPCKGGVSFEKEVVECNEFEDLSSPLVDGVEYESIVIPSSKVDTPQNFPIVNVPLMHEYDPLTQVSDAPYSLVVSVSDLNDIEVEDFKHDTEEGIVFEKLDDANRNKCVSKELKPKISFPYVLFSRKTSLESSINLSFLPSYISSPLLKLDSNVDIPNALIFSQPHPEEVLDKPFVYSLSFSFPSFNSFPFYCDFCFCNIFSYFCFSLFCLFFYLIFKLLYIECSSSMYDKLLRSLVYYLLSP